MKYLVSLLFMMSCCLIQAQVLPATNSTEKFIEVKVSDTIMVTPDIVSLMVSLESENEDYATTDVSSYDSSSYDEDEKKQKEAEEKLKAEYALKRNKVEDVFKRNNVAYKYHEKKNEKGLFGKEISMYEDAYEVTVTNIALVEKIKKELAALKNVSCNVAESKLGDKEKYELLLIDKVMKKAEREATAIAKAMGVTLDKPLNVSNQSMDNMYSSMFNNPESMGGMGALFSMMGSMFKGGSQQNTQVAVSKSLVVRYGIK